MTVTRDDPGTPCHLQALPRWPLQRPRPLLGSVPGFQGRGPAVSGGATPPSAEQTCASFLPPSLAQQPSAVRAQAGELSRPRAGPRPPPPRPPGARSWSHRQLLWCPCPDAGGEGRGLGRRALGSWASSGYLTPPSGPRCFSADRPSGLTAGGGVTRAESGGSPSMLVPTAPQTVLVPWPRGLYSGLTLGTRAPGRGSPVHSGPPATPGAGAGQGGAPPTGWLSCLCAVPGARESQAAEPSGCGARASLPVFRGHLNHACSVLNIC